MQFKQIRLSNAEFAADIVASMDTLYRTVDAAYQEYSRSNLTAYEKNLLRQYLGKALLTASEAAVRTILDNPSIEGNDRVRALEEWNQRVSYWHSELGKERSASLQLLCTIPQDALPYFCHDIDVSRAIDQVLLNCEEHLSALAAISSTSSSAGESISFNLMWGLVYGIIAGIRTSIYMDHPELIPDDDWQEIIKHNKADIERTKHSKRGRRGRKPNDLSH